jgi:photosystem II stability/assembly factor-like uncharacterized protein
MSKRLVLLTSLLLPITLACSLLSHVFPTPAGSTPPPPLPWEPAGFGGAGNFLGVYFDPNQPGVVYATSNVAGVFRSTDYGDHWQMRSIGLGNYEISSFAVDPFDSDTLYAGVGAVAFSNNAGMYVSHDAGLTWAQLPATAANSITFRKYRTADAIAPDPAQSGTLISGSRENGIWRTTDGGASWRQVVAAPTSNAPLFDDGTIEDDRLPDPHPTPISVVAFDPANPTVVYAGLDGAGILKSIQGGVADSWQSINNGLPDEAMVKDLGVGSDNVLYAAVGMSGVFKSADGGNSWQAANGALPELGEAAWVSSIAVHPIESNTAYLTLATYDYPNVWKTTDGGATWTPAGEVTYDPVNNPTETWATNPTLSWQVALEPHDPDRVFYVSFWDIYRSDDGGEHWSTKIVGAQNTCVTDLVLDGDGALFATHMDAGLLKSTDGGATWTAVLPNTETGFNPAMTGHFWNFAIAQVAETTYYYVTSDPWTPVVEEQKDLPVFGNPVGYGQVLRSNDGLTWTSVFTSTQSAGWMGGGMLGLAVDPNQSSTLYITQDGGQVFKSTDNGDTWAPTDGQPDDNSFTYALAVDDSGRLFAGTLLGGLWRSTDGGMSWENVLPDLGSVFHLLAVPGAIYASGDDGNLYRSVDGGDTWERLTDSPSVDDGDGVGNMGRVIAVDPSDANRILFSRTDTWHNADAGSGLVESRDGGKTWTPLNAGLPHRSVSALAVASDGTVFAGTWCGGIWRLPTTDGP